MERLIVFALLFLLPTQLAYHFWIQSSYILGLRVDYLSPAIYLTDILIVFFLPYLVKRIKAKGIKLRKSALFFLLIITTLAILNIVFAQSWTTALLKWVTVLKFFLLGLYFYLCDLAKLRKIIASALSLSLITFVLIGLIQFILQKTIGGPLYYLGERTFTSQTPGIALMNIFGNSFMRPYSTFPHPNSFAGFVVVSFFIFLSLKSPRLKSFSGSVLTVLIFAVLSLLITLSLNAIIGICLLVVFYLALNNFAKVVKKAKVFLPILIVFFSFLFGFVSFIFPKNILLGETYLERVILASYAMETFINKPVLGVGLNNFFLATKNVQPPHNVYLIVLAETGLFGTILLFLLMSKLFNQKINKYLFLALVFVFFTGFFDHYWFTLQQNELLLSILLGLSVRNYNNRKDA